MRRRTGSLVVVVLLLAPGRPRGQQGPGEQLSSGQSGGTIYGTVVQAFGETRLRNVPIYVFTLAQSRRLREMDESAYRRAHAPGIADDDAGAIESRGEDALAARIPKIPRTAFGKSGSQGVFVFHNLPSGKRYYLVAVHAHESGLFLAIKVTALLKDGERLKVDLRDDVPWKERFRTD